MTILSRWIAKHKKECDNDFYNFRYINKRAVYFEKIILRLNLDDAIDYLEFGVCEGNSFKWWVERIKNPQANFYGFDTFTGLPES